MRTGWLSILCAATVGILALYPASAQSARLLQVYIEQDGEVVAHTYYDDGGRADAATVWRYLQSPPIMVEDDADAVESDEDDPRKARLEGDVQLKIQHVDRVIAQARLTELTLHRSDVQTPAWYLPAGEVERTAAVAGLGPPRPPVINSLANSISWLTVLVLLGVIVVGSLVIVLILNLRRNNTRAVE